MDACLREVEAKKIEEAAFITGNVTKAIPYIYIIIVVIDSIIYQHLKFLVYARAFFIF